MDEKLLSKLAEVLKSHGLAEEDIEKVKAELTEEEPKEESTEEKPSEEVETEAPAPESSVAEGEEEKVEETEESKPVESEETEVEEKVEESPVEESPVSEEPVSEEPSEPVEEPSDLPPGVSEVDPSGELPPVEEPVEQSQPDYQSLVNQLEEKDKAIQGLYARIEAMESALKECGVMSSVQAPTSPVGVDDPTRVADYHDDDASFEATLREINRPQY